MKQEITKEFLLEEYVKKQRSTFNIAKEIGTYAETINRALDKFGIPKRNPSQALSTAYKTGSKEHPTRGKKSSEETKLAISEANYKSWHSKTEEEKQKHSDISKTVWDRKTAKEKSEFIKKGIDGIRKASKTGSKLEHFIMRLLINNGYDIVFHYNKILANEKLEVDIFVKGLGAAIEIDGPSHFFPVWGEEALEKTKRADTQKMGLVLGKGLHIIRLRHFGDTKSDKYLREVSKLILETLEKIKQNNSGDPQYIELTPTEFTGQLTENENKKPKPIQEKVTTNAKASKTAKKPTRPTTRRTRKPRKALRQFGRLGE